MGVFVDLFQAYLHGNPITAGHEPDKADGMAFAAALDAFLAAGAFPSLSCAGDLQLNGGAGYQYITRPNVAGQKLIQFAVSGGGILDDVLLNSSQVQTTGTFYSHPYTGLNKGYRADIYGSGTSTGPFNFNEFKIWSDNVSGANGSGFDYQGEGFTVSHYAGGGAMRGARSAFSAYYYGTAASSAANNNRNYVGGTFVATAQSSDGGTSPSAAGTARGAYFGVGSVGVAMAGATALFNLTGGEVNVAAQTGSSMWAKSLLQLSARADDAVAGSGVNAAVWIYNQSAANPAWTDGILFDNGGGAGSYPFGPTSKVLRVAGGSIGTGIDFSASTISGSAFASPGFAVNGSGTSMSLSGATAGIELGAVGASNLPYIDWHSGATGVDYDVRLQASGGTGTNGASTFSVTAAQVVCSGVPQPAADNATTFGTAAKRWSVIYAGTGTINTSDAAFKENVQTVDPRLAEAMVRTLEARTFVWKDDDIAAEFETRTVTRQKTRKVSRTETFEEVTEIGGIWTVVTSDRVVEIDEPVFDEVLLFNEDGTPAMHTERVHIGNEVIKAPATEKVPAFNKNGEQVGFTERPLLDEEGNVVYRPVLGADGHELFRPIFSTAEVQRTHSVPVMETVEERIEVSPAYSKKNVRTHYGFIAQEVLAVLQAHGIDTKDFAALCRDDTTGRWGLRYEQFIPILWSAVKTLTEKVQRLEENISTEERTRE